VSHNIEWRVTCLGISPRYYHGPNGRYQAWQAAQNNRHLQPRIWWRHQYGTGSSPWYDLEHRDPNTQAAVTA
jgi:hypothetical protein